MSAAQADAGPLAQELVARLVATDSRNPVLAPDAAGEAAIAALVAAFLRDAGLEVTLVGDPARPSVVGRLRGTGGGRALLLNGHIDTVGFGGMMDPTAARTAAGRLYGRGANDMKGGVAAMLAAAAALAAGPALPGDLLVHRRGRRGACQSGHPGGRRAPVASGRDGAGGHCHRADGPRRVYRAQGLRLGHADHAGPGGARQPAGRRRGRDRHMGRVLVALEALDAELQTRPAHPLLGHGSQHASLIQGGTELSTYPARCELQIERRTLPGETPATVAAEIEAILARCRAADAQFQAEAVLTLDRPPLETAADEPLVRALLDAARAQAGAPALTGATFLDRRGATGRGGHAGRGLRAARRGAARRRRVGGSGERGDLCPRAGGYSASVLPGRRRGRGALTGEQRTTLLGQQSLPHAHILLLERVSRSSAPASSPERPCFSSCALRAARGRAPRLLLLPLSVWAARCSFDASPAVTASCMVRSKAGVPVTNRID